MLNLIDLSSGLKPEKCPFLENVRELEPAGTLTQDKSYKFKFKDFDK